MSDLIAIRPFKDPLGVGDSVYKDNEQTELLPVHKDVMYIRTLLQQWTKEQLAPTFFVKRVLLNFRVFLMLFLALFVIFMLPIPFKWKKARYILMGVVTLCFPVALYMYHKLCLERCLIRAMSVNDLQNIAFNYLTGSFFLAELLIPRKKGPTAHTASHDHTQLKGRTAPRNVEFDRVLVGFGGYRMYMDKDDTRGRSSGISTVGDVRFLYVRPEFRRRGVGSMLMQHIYEHASKQEYLGLIASCDGYTPENELFLKNNGFRLLERVQRQGFWERLFGLRGDKCLYDRSVLPADADEDVERDWVGEVDTSKPGKTELPGGNLRRRQGKAPVFPGSSAKYEKLDPSVLREDKAAAMRRMYEYLETSSNQYVDKEELRGGKGTKNYPFAAGASGLVGDSSGESDGVYRGKQKVFVKKGSTGKAGTTGPPTHLSRDTILRHVSGVNKDDIGSGRYTVTKEEATVMNGDQLQLFLASLERE